ncbi:hypothetical protein [Nostoc sp. CHAB 5715]|uniref:hypothetical protein n=1 Tax=Nostoc sp. CHAB 5715 TaxID=2780400 RepID=UPI001E48ED02|nr:hypothetical protein [Nostoc sp. CHAB 5715]MCC5622432.1 hypothetical protein [Nostoc sp. CHAB 5715]
MGDYFQKEIKDLASKLGSKPKEVNKYEDEFGGRAGYTKILMNKNKDRDEL